MIPRYASPIVTELWSPLWAYQTWLEVELTTLAAQRELGFVPEQETKDLLDWLRRIDLNEGVVADIAQIEQTTQHDVVAFLQRIRGARGKGDARWIHYGLTSSDVVDTAQGMRFRKMRNVGLSALGNLLIELSRRTQDRTPVIGRTHGQTAELMELRARAWGWLRILSTAAAELSRFTDRMTVCKLSGPVGTYAHNTPEVERWVATRLGLRPHGPGATQIASRAPLAAWASSANLVVQACAKIAHDIRLMNLLGEARIQNAPGQVGSSSMAHKQNPIRAEKIGGMARLAQGYATMLQPLDVWLERDMSHSSVERVAVPDLWHVTLHTIEQTTELLQELDPQPADLSKAGAALVSPISLELIRSGEDVEVARQAARAVEGGSARVMDAVDAMRNYPGPS